MIFFNCDGDNSNIPQRFQVLVNRCLPAGCSFTISPQPRTGIRVFSDAFGRETVSSFRVEGRAQMAAGPAAPADTPAWKVRFRDQLQMLCGNTSGRIEMALGSDHPGVLVGQFAGILISATIDVQDLERLPQEAAAGAIIHELEEQRRRQVAGQGFNDAHIGAAASESSILGGIRLTDRERSSVPDRGRAASWVWWIPIQIAGGSIRTLVIQGSFLNIVSSSFRPGTPFPNIAAFNDAFDARPGATRP